ALYHEDMHAEAYLMALQTLGLPEPQRAYAEPLPPAAPLAVREVVFEGGRFTLGTRSVGRHSAESIASPAAQPRAANGDFVFDNELTAHEVTVAPFSLATSTVTQGEYRAFVEDGGYRERRFWSQAGWAWRAAAQATQPR